MKEIKPRSECPVSYTLDFLGDKWSLLILRDMVIKGKSSYGEFLESDEKIATNILANRLIMLEKNGFLTKKVALDKKSKNIYSLTAKGISLVPVLLEMAVWGSKYQPGLDKEIKESYLKDREGTIRKIKTRLGSDIKN